ncbi:MAG: C-GCAxxG-C-C family protein [Ruminococcus sp.]
MNHAEKARDLFRAGYNCAQSVVGAFHEEMGLSLEDAVRLASSFGGGMGGMRETCGAVTGMFLVAGMLKGYDDPADYDGKKAHYARIRELAEQFRQKHDTLVCRELLQALPGKLKQDPSHTEEYYKVRPCVRFVGGGGVVGDAGRARFTERDEKPPVTQHHRRFSLSFNIQ